MTESRFPDYKLVAFAPDRARVLRELASSQAPVLGLATDHTQFPFKIVAVRDEFMLLEEASKPSRPPGPREALTFVFGLSEGQYFVKAVPEPSGPGTYRVSLQGELFCLQRRTGLRARIPGHLLVSLRILEVNGRAMKSLFPVTDVSTRGLAFHKDISIPPPLKARDRLVGELQAPGRAALRLNGEVMRVAPEEQGSGILVGLELRELTFVEEQELLSLSMEIQRRMFESGR